MSTLTVLFFSHVKLIESDSCILIFVMGLTMLRMDTSKARWRVKLEAAFVAKSAKADAEGKSIKWILFTLPFITVLREGLEAVVFIGGVSVYLPNHPSPSDKAG